MTASLLASPGVLASIPSPSQGVWHLGPFPVRAYAFCILLGIAVAVWLSRKRWEARGGDPALVLDVATYAVPLGVIGGRIYHVITSPEAYFGADGEPIKALYIWEGGLGIWGAVVLGGVGAWIAVRRAGVKLPPFADAIAPGIVLAQAIGRFGNWFNNELYGKPTDLPWGLQIHDWDSSAGRAVTDADGNPVVLGTFHPTFLYESIWDVGVAVVLLLIDRRWKLGHGRVFASYCLLYVLGRGWIEALRIDPAEHFFHVRLNVWTSIVVGVGAVLYLVISARLRPGRETEVRRTVEAETGAEGEPGAVGDEADVHTADQEPADLAEAVPSGPSSDKDVGTKSSE